MNTIWSRQYSRTGVESWFRVRGRSRRGIILVALACLMTACSAATPTNTDSNSTAKASGWLMFKGLAVGSLVDSVEDGKLPAQTVQLDDGAALSKEEAIRTAVEEAAFLHETVACYGADDDIWLQADPLVYDVDTVTVRIRVWERNELTTDEQQEVSFL